MTDNPILDELHQTRQHLLEDAGGTLEGLVSALQQRQKQSGHTILSHPTNTSDVVSTVLTEQPNGENH